MIEDIIPGSMRRATLYGLIIISLAPVALGGQTADGAAERDAYLRGYIEAWLWSALGVGPGMVTVEVEDAVVTLTGVLATPEMIDRTVAAVASFEGVRRLINRLEIPAPQERPGRWSSWWRWSRPAAGRKTTRFPVGDLFAPPLADQKQPRFYTTWQRYRLDHGDFNIGSVGFGENFGLVRWPREREGDGWQVGISGAVFAIFNLDARSKDLLNADYIVGVPISYRSGVWSARARIFHQSSHLGDEFLLNPQPGPPVERINLSYEALEVLVSWERRGYRIYGGGVRIVASDTSLGRDRAQVGFEYRGSPMGWRTARMIAGVDLQA